MHNRGSIIGGLILILVGALFLLMQAFPEFAAQFNPGLQWPLLIVAVGLLFIVGAVLGEASLAVPGVIIGGMGVMLYYQNLSGNWASWAYAWTLIPGFVGLGLMLMGVLDSQKRSSIRDGFRLLLISLIMFAFFGGFLGGFTGLVQFWPVLLIVVGVWLLWRNRSRQQGPQRSPAVASIGWPGVSGQLVWNATFQKRSRNESEVTK